MRSLSILLSNVLRLVILTTVLLFSTMPVLADMTVDTAWVRRYNGPGDSDDRAYAIVVDDFGNVYVTGWSYLGSGTNLDYATVKYYENGDTAWVRRYNGVGDGDDAAFAMALDASGNVYVTGLSGGYCTIKYCPNGDTGWVRIYHRPGEQTERAQAIAVDGCGNVYVTGCSYYGSVSNIDFCTVKYYANGDTAWVRIFSGPGYQFDEARALAVDDSSNIYVTGYATDMEGSRCTTIKYYPNGDTAWVRRYGYGSANAIALDHSGNVYVTGQCGLDYTTVKYNPDGDTAWVRSYDGTGNNNDEAHAIAVDDSGNVYVTGYSFRGWTPGANYDYATIKYNPNGDTAWVRRYNGPGNSWDEAQSIALDGSGSVYVTGFCDGGYNSPGDYATIKYHPTGDTAWVKIYNGPGNSDDRACAIVVDGYGSVYVTGHSFQMSGSPYNSDYAAIKYVQFLCGDINQDGILDIGDVVRLINYLYKSGPPPIPIVCAGDCNCDGIVDLGDAIYLLNYLFKNGPPPCEP